MPSLDVIGLWFKIWRKMDQKYDNYEYDKSSIPKGKGSMKLLYLFLDPHNNDKITWAFTFFDDANFMCSSWL